VTAPLESGTLYVVATPIGNLSDVTLRALAVLGSADVIFAEDTRHTRRFMTHHGLKVRLVSAHAHNEAVRAKELVRRLGTGESVALVTDAGSPGLSDPGARLVAAATAAGFPTLPVPGPSALVAALSVSGLSADSFTFAGFLPARPAARKRRLEELLDRGETIVFFEAPHRVRTTLGQLAELAPDHRMAACREMTKRFEEVLRGTVVEVRDSLSKERERGEWTIIVAAPGKGGPKRQAKTKARARNAPETPAARLRLEEELIAQGLTEEEAGSRAAFIFGGEGSGPRGKRR
jgi:16S rRNA (cytidine1402-2'-O)-methyltransferase